MRAPPKERPSRLFLSLGLWFCALLFAGPEAPVHAAEKPRPKSSQKKDNPKGSFDDLMEIHGLLQENKVGQARRRLEKVSRHEWIQPFQQTLRDLAKTALLLPAGKELSQTEDSLRKAYGFTPSAEDLQSSATRMGFEIPQPAPEPRSAETDPSSRKAEKPKFKKDLPTLRKAWLGGDTAKARKIAESIRYNRHKLSCQPKWIYAHFVKGRLARSAQDRKAFFRHQKEVGKQLKKNKCEPRHFGMATRTFQDFRLSELNWTARLYWENDQLEEATEFAEMAFEEGLAHGETEAVRESLQVLVGRVAYETHPPREALAHIEHIQERLRRSSAGSEEKHRESLRDLQFREGLFAFMNRDFTTCAGLFQELLTQHLGEGTDSWSKRRTLVRTAYWQAKCLSLSTVLGAQSKITELWKLIHTYAATGYYAMRMQQNFSFAKPRGDFSRIPFRLNEEDWPIPKADANETENRLRQLKALLNSLAASRQFAQMHWDHPLRTSVTEWASAEIKENEVHLFEKDATTLSRSLVLLAGSRRFQEVVLSAGRLSRHYRLDHPKASTIRRFLYPPAFTAEFKKAGQLCTIDQKLLYAVSRQESLFDPMAVSHAGARGLLQVMPQVWRQFIADNPKLVPFVKADEPFDVQSNLIVGACHLKEALTAYHGNLVFALAGYNAGRGAVNEWIRRRFKNDLEMFIEFIPYGETQTYVKRILRSIHQLQSRKDSSD